MPIMSAALKSCFVLLGFILAYITYLLLGALIFSAIERPVEEDLKADLSILKSEFLNLSCINATALEVFLERILQANKYGVSILENASVRTNWDLASSLFFANTMVTTVGYGHTTPLSDAGKAFSILYALIGVPFTMLVLTACVQRLMHPLTYGPISMCQKQAGLHPRTASVVHFIVLVVLVVLAFFVVPAVVFSTIEESWSFLDAFYFCFISLCTIGLGDFVPGEKPGQSLRGLYKISVMVYLFVGLMVMFLVLRTFHKLADVHGWTAFFQLPSCDEEDEDKEPIIEQEPDEESSEPEKASVKPLDPSSQVSYNSING
ncbi:potassium channel subfamily K member 6-like [Myxocyprinus asiaticus]|uniref:potassium channel subfamily K member 6-like n=1 Tax=Myxocyprinus asiaticus TaxID=70543 RepID=UPI002221F9F6|nr:potassium channel subfamily K member 6-like [Myxocyprinus asiaticus]